MEICGQGNCNHHLSLPDSGWLRLLVAIFWGLDFTKRVYPEVLTGIWPAVGTYGGADFNHHLSLPDSGWLRLLVKIFWGLDSHQSTTGWGPPFLSAQIGSMFWTLFGRRWGNGWFECVLGKPPLTHIRINLEQLEPNNSKTMPGHVFLGTWGAGYWE